MADIDLYQDDGEDTQGDDLGYLGSWIDSGDDSGLGGEDLEGFVPDDLLTPLQRMEKYMDSENIFSRQMVARSLMETIRAVGENQEDANAVLRNMVRLAEDSESTIRADLMEQVPNVAMYCHENQHLFENPLPTFILPIITRYLVDSHNHVRKTSQAALLVLLEQDLIERGDFELQVCPVILDLSSPDSIDDFRTEAVALMSKMAPLVGKEITVRTFMPRFADMCTDALFHVRKVCAANFGDMCTVVGQDNVEKHLIDKFTYLCEDGVWGVRKACAECFMTVSCACSLEMRRNELAVVFINLICDQSRWVRMAAFQALGGFISTFADPINTGLYFNEEGILVAGNPEDFNSKLCEDDFKGSDQAHEIISEILQQTSGIRLPSNSEVMSRKDGQEAGAGDATSSDNLEPEAMDIDEMASSEEMPESDESSGHTPIMTSAANPSLEEQRAEAYSEHLDRLSSSSPEKTHPSESPTDKKCDKDSGIDSVGQSDNNMSRTLENLSSSNSDSKLCDTSSSPSSPPSSSADSLVSDANSPSTSSSPPSPSTRPVHIHLENTSEEFNSFNYWRMPLPELDIDFDLVNGQPTNIHVTTRLKDEEEQKVLTASTNVEVAGDSSVTSHTELVVTNLEKIEIEEKDEVSGADKDDNDEEEDDAMMHVASVRTVSDEVSPEETVTNIGSTHVLGQHVNETTMTIVNGVVQDVSNASLSYSPRESPDSETPDHDQYGSDENLYLQNVIPQALLDHYLSMTDPSRAQTVDTDIARHCAYSLPAVAYTLGRRYWPCLKELYETLAADMQWKVRRTLAFSIHDLAVIVGQEITTQDLVPIFNGFLKDLDEVRIGVLKHLADFLRLLKPEHRRDYLDKIPDFLNTDNNRNWRFREELSAQLILLNELYTPYEVSEYLLPIAVTLADDKVAEVRQMAFRGLACMVRRMNTTDKTLVVTFINDIIQRFAHSSKWSKRQIFAQCCQALLEEQSMNPQVFAQALMPSLLALGSDPIPNVRIALAKTVSMHILYSEYFTSANNPHHEDLLRTVKCLKSDCDRDVRNFMNGQQESVTEVTDMIPV